MTECLPIVQWLKNWFYDKTETDALLDGKSDTTHTHTWKSQSCTAYGTLYINETIRMCELRYVRTFESATADTFYTWHTGAIPSEYRPSSQVQGAINQVGTIYVDSTGLIGGKLAKSWSSNRQVNGTVMWHY